MHINAETIADMSSLSGKLQGDPGIDADILKKIEGLPIPADIPKPGITETTVASIAKIPSDMQVQGRNKICIIGYPSRVGGADTELDHQIDAWLQLGLEVHVVPTGDVGSIAKGILLDERGCIVHKPYDWKACRNMHCISYCNGQYLENAAKIKEYSLSSTFVNCMTWLFPKETEAVKNKLIDYEIYQRQEVMNNLFPQLYSSSPHIKAFMIKPYFRATDFPYIPYSERRHDKFIFGRINRADSYKYHKDSLKIYDDINSPVPKECILLGVNDSIAQKLGRFPDWVRGYREGRFTQTEFYRYVDHIINPADPNHTENLPRIAFEAMSSGVVLVVDDKGGWQELVEHNVTGFRCETPEDYVNYGTLLANDRKLAADISGNARQWLDAEYSMTKSLWRWESFFIAIGVL